MTRDLAFLVGMKSPLAAAMLAGLGWACFWATAFSMILDALGWGALSDAEYMITVGWLWFLVSCELPLEAEL